MIKNRDDFRSNKDSNITMKILPAIFVFAFLPFLSWAQNLSDRYTIYAPQQMNAETLQDFRYLLGKSTGKNWKVQSPKNNTGQGIYLQVYTDNAFTAKESFRIQSNGTDLLTITSSSIEGLTFGFYKYLRQAGFNFFLPGEDYTIVPKTFNPFGKKRNVVDQPFLQIRDFAGTGGFGSGNSDTGQSVEKAWNLWRVRNGFGVAYPLAGHRGENFILENKPVLQKHPQWLVSPLTGNDYKDQGIKLNYLNKDAVNFYTDWTIQSLIQSKAALPPPNHTEFVSIEPSDGGGYPNEKETKKSLPSISDQVYAAANLAAQKLDKLFPTHPNIGVNLYAYSSHAAPPSFPLNPRVFVQLIPYQFQNVAFGPSFIKLWASKAKRFGLYDYYNYTDAQFDLPGGLTIDEAMKRLVHSVKNRSEGTTYETSYSKFATGIPLWVLSRYMADGDADWKLNLETLVRSLYKEAAPKIAGLFQLFYSESSFGPQYMGNAIKLLGEANTLAKDAVVQNRINELKEYLQFVHLVYLSRDAQNATSYQRLLPVAEYAWKIYPQAIVSSYRIMQLVSYAFLNIDKSDKEYALYQKLHVQWFPETERSKATWAKVGQGIPVSEITRNFASLKNSYTVSPLPAGYDLSDVQNLINRSFKPKRTLVFGGSSLVRGYFGVYTDRPTTISIHYKIDGNKPLLTFSSIDRNYSHDTAIVAEKTEGMISIQLPAGETTLFLNAGPGCTYRIQADISQGFYFFDSSPRGKMAFYKKFSDPYEEYTYEASFYPSHFYVPKNVLSVDYRVQSNTLAISNPLGHRINSQMLFATNDDFETRRFLVQPTETGTIWKAVVSGNFNYSFQNIPDRYLLLEEK